MAVEAYIKNRKLVMPLAGKAPSHQLVLHGEVEYEAYYCQKKNRMNARKVVFRK